MISRKLIINLIYIKIKKTVISYKYNEYKHKEISLFYSVLNSAIEVNNLLSFHHSLTIFSHWNFKHLWDNYLLVMSLRLCENDVGWFSIIWRRETNF